MQTLSRLIVIGLATIPWTATAAEPRKTLDDETAIRAAIDAYVAAYNKGDAKALAALWSETGEWVAPDGERLTGRKEIEATMKAIFAAQPKSRIELGDVRVRLLTADTALEEGTARIVRPGEAPEDSSYQAVHVKKQGKWHLESVREIASAETAEVSSDHPLAALSWLVGDWVDAAEDSVIETSVEWTLNKRFLVCHFRAEFAGMEPLIGSQVIGYDAAAGVIRSWLFDADGTIGEGTWTNDGKQWVVKSSQVLADGRRGSSTNIYAPRDADSYTWKSIGRKVDDEFLPNIEEVTVVRSGNAVAQADDDDDEVDPTSDAARRRD